MIVISFSGIDSAIATMARAKNWKRPSLAAVAATVERQTVFRIVSGKTSPDGAPWTPLSPETIARKGTNNILVDTGGFAGSISHTSGSETAVIGTNKAQAGYLQDGTKRMPARPFLGISQSNETEIERVFGRVIEGLLR